MNAWLWSRAVLLVGGLVLAGCTTLKPAIEGLAVAASGRLAIRIDAIEPDAQARSSTAFFELLGQPERGELRLSNSLGTLLAVAYWQPGEAWLRAEGKTRRFNDLDELTREMVGEPLPVAALFDWLQGRPWAGASSEPLPDGEAGFAQLGWRVQLAQAGEGLISAVRPAPPTVTVRARLDPT